jgi:hypothetical protein
MAKKKVAKKKTTKKTAAGGDAVQLCEESEFFLDDETTNPDKNARLAALLTGPMFSKSIVSVERVEIGDRKGWRFIYRS